MLAYRSPGWLPGSGPGIGALGGNAQTLWPALLARRFTGPAPAYARERWATPDADFIDVDWQAPGAAPSPAPLLVLFHGLEGSSSSHYAQAFAHWAREHGWAYAVPHFRGCSGELNLAPRAYHSGDFEEIGWILARFRALHTGPVVAVGVSLGGNALLRWAEEAGDSALQHVCAVAAVSAPVDLAASGHAIGRGFNRFVYTRLFLNSMKPKALRKLTQFPGLFSRKKMLAARDLFDFDNLFTAPLHGFRDTPDYWRRGSARPHLLRIRVPALVLNAQNDPFVPASCLPDAAEVSPSVTLWQPAHGGHVGFPAGRFPGHLQTLPERVMDWMKMHLP